MKEYKSEPHFLAAASSYLEENGIQFSHSTLIIQMSVGTAAGKTLGPLPPS